MAMRQQPGTSTVSSTRTRQLVGRQGNENFEPLSEMKEEADAHVLLIQLPGFTKERVRITYVHSSRIVRVNGDRPIDKVRWIRFSQAFPVPEICDVEKIHAKFEQGVLTIKMPKKVPTVLAPPPKQESPLTTATTPPKSSTSTATAPAPAPAPSIKPAAPVPKQEKKQEVSTPEKPTVTPAPSSSPQKALAGKDEAGAEERTQRPPLPSIGRKEEGVLPPKAVVETKPLKDQDKIAQETSLAKQVGKKSEEVKSDCLENVKEVKKEAEKAHHAESSLSKKPEKKAMVTQKETKEDSKASGLHGFASVLNEAKERRGVATDHGDERKPPQKDMSYTMGKRIKEMSASGAGAVTRMAKRMNDEDKQLLMNMGAAILVIAALGAYVTYRISSSGKSDK